MYTHLIFGTKGRARLIQVEQLPKLHAYLGGTLNGMHCPVICVGGTEDHVHILFMLDKNTALADVVEQLKRASSKWMKTQSPENRYFAWQEGYAAFSVSQSKMETVKRYIQGQAEHHKKVPFLDELKQFLEAYNTAYDERYL